jgi:hypothetical protein
MVSISHGDTAYRHDCVAPDDVDLRATLTTFCTVRNAVSEAVFNGGKPVRAVELQRAVDAQVKGQLCSQMTITALRLVAGAYASATRMHARPVRAEARRQAHCEATGRAYQPRVIPP